MHFEAVSLWGTHKKATAPNIPSSPFSLMTESIFSSLQSNLHMLGNYPHKTDQSKVPVNLCLLETYSKFFCFSGKTRCYEMYNRLKTNAMNEKKRKENNER